LQQERLVCFNGREDHKDLVLSRRFYIVHTFASINLTLQGCRREFQNHIFHASNSKFGPRNLQQQLSEFEDTVGLMSTYRWVARNRIWTSVYHLNSQLSCTHILIDNDSLPCFSNQQAPESSSKWWTLNTFGEQHPPGPFGTNLKNVYVNKLCELVGIMLNSGQKPSTALICNDLEIQALDVLMQNPTTNVAGKGYSDH